MQIKFHKGDSSPQFNKIQHGLQVRLPGLDGKVVPGLGREVQIVGSGEWESLQGRLAAVV